jgi:hypothetical protein
MKKSYGGVNPRRKEDENQDDEKDEEEEIGYIDLFVSYGVVMHKGRRYASKSTRATSPTTHLTKSYRLKLPVKPEVIEVNLQDILSKAPFHKKSYIKGTYGMAQKQ